MSDKIFFDANVILYCYSDKPEKKKAIAKTHILNSDGVVMQEMCNVLIKKFHQNHLSLSKVLAELNKNFFVFINNIETINSAFYDSLIIASALENECSILYSEDLHHNQKIEKTLTIINLFI